MKKVEETLRYEGSLKVTRRGLGIGGHRLFALKDANSNVITNIYEVIE